MDVKNELTASLHSAMKNKDIERRTALRLALSAIKNAEIDKGEELENTKIFSILQKEVKMKEETLAEAIKADRKKLIATLEREIVSYYLSINKIDRGIAQKADLLFESGDRDILSHFFYLQAIPGLKRLHIRPSRLLDDDMRSKPQHWFLRHKIDLKLP